MLQILRIYALSSLLILLANTVFPQTKDEEAMALYDQAAEAYENGQYIQCDQSLARIHVLLGVWNPKTLYLTIKDLTSLNVGKRFTLQNFSTEKSLIDSFFQKVDKSTYPPEKYREIINIKLDIDRKLDIMKRRKALYDDLKRREVSFIRDTIDVYAKAFVADFLEGIKKNRKGRGEWFPLDLEYITNNHSIKVFYNKNQNRDCEISMIQFFSFESDKWGQMIRFKKLKISSPAEGNENVLITFERHYNEPEHYLPTYDLSEYVKKLQELKAILESTRFDEFFNNEYGFIDIK